MLGLSLFDDTGLRLCIETSDDMAERAKWSDTDLSVPASCAVQAVMANCKSFICV